MTNGDECKRAREALEAAYKNHGAEASDLNKFELFAYADIQAGVDESDAVELAADVLNDPPAAADPEETSAGWIAADFIYSTTGWPEDILDYGGWMTHKGDKRPYAPWTDPNAPAPCNKCGTTADECPCSARYKWGWEENHRPFEEMEPCLIDPQIDGPVYIQREADPFVFVDGDDVRCPESGDVHPAFIAVLCHLGFSYADISLSGKGVHAYYRGDLPEGETAAAWEIDDEPWGENDDLPAIEIYSGKHVCVTTGKQVGGTPNGVRPWDAEVVWTLLEANEQFTDDPFEDFGLGGGSCADTPAKKGDGDGDTAPEDCIRALNRLDASRVAEKTIVREWTDAGGAGRGFLPVWGSSDDGGTANFVDHQFWVDTGQNGGRGGPIEMALIDLGELRNQNSEVGYASGADFWTGYEHLRDLGFRLPAPPYANDGDDGSVADYYDAPLDEYVDGDPWSDPDVMLEACLKAREDGVVDSDATPPTLALTPIVRELLGGESMGESTKEMATEVYLDELGAGDFEDGEVLI